MHPCINTRSLELCLTHLIPSPLNRIIPRCAEPIILNNQLNPLYENAPIFNKSSILLRTHPAAFRRSRDGGHSTSSHHWSGLTTHHYRHEDCLQDLQ